MKYHKTFRGFKTKITGFKFQVVNIQKGTHAIGLPFFYQDMQNITVTV